MLKNESLLPASDTVIKENLPARRTITVDGNEAAASVAYRINELVAIYPITPSSTMAELADEWAAKGKRNIWGSLPLVQEMQSEGGAAGAAHGALQTGALTTTFTASQGLLLMIPNMFKIAGELTSTVFHITARAIATHALSIFCDHSDVMAARATGWGMLFANSGQEAHDFALIAQASSLHSHLPFMHIFDGFRTSHEVTKIEELSDDDLHALIPDELIQGHRNRALSPEHPVLRGTAQNPDVFFQSRERINSFYEKAPSVVESAMQKFEQITGRHYQLFDYEGAPDAERVIVIMGSGAETVAESVDWLVSQGEKVGVIKVRLFRPFSAEHFLEALPLTATALAVLDRTKEPGAVGEPLFEDVITSIFHCRKSLKVIGGRYGLGSKEFTPAMAKAVFDEMKQPEPKKHFTVGINDDLTHLSLNYDELFDIKTDELVQAIFWGLGSDGTVGANKNSIKIIGDQTNNYVQGYFVYDSKKSGSVTVSHLRFGKQPIRRPYLINKANFVAIHQFGLISRLPVLDSIINGGTVLINSPYKADEVWDKLPLAMQKQITDKHLQVFVLDGYRIAKEHQLGNRINTIMQTAFFALSRVLEPDQAIAQIKHAIRKSYGKFGEPVVRQNCAAVDAAITNLVAMPVPVIDEQKQVTEQCFTTGQQDKSLALLADNMFLSNNSLSEMIAGRGNQLPVSAMPEDGTYPTGTAQYEKRNIAQEIPVWDPSVCIQCGKCVMVCPHAVIRAKLASTEELKNAPETLKSVPASWRESANQSFILQVAPEDCTGCALCVEVCPAKNKSQTGRKAINMETQKPILEQEKINWQYFLSLPDQDQNNGLHFNSVKNVQLLRPLFEFSGACAGCGETPYVKLVSQLFGDHMVVANATGCSSIYGGNLPATPWAKNAQGLGPAWSNSLFEDNAEFGLGMRLALKVQSAHARKLVLELEGIIGNDLASELLASAQTDTVAINGIREKLKLLKERLQAVDDVRARDLLSLADAIIRKSVWIIGGDGWAYDIGYGGLDHVLASGEDVNILVLDTEVYSNTGGQMSKATARGAVAKFAAAGKSTGKKDLGRLAMDYGNVYVARIAMGANDSQTVKALLEAESYPGPSLVIAYCHCIAHGIDMNKGMNQQKLAVQSGHWPLYRYDPRLRCENKNPFQLDSQPPSISLEDYYYSEARYRMLQQSEPDRASQLLLEAKQDIANNWRTLTTMAAGNADQS